MYYIFSDDCFFSHGISCLLKERGVNFLNVPIADIPDICIVSKLSILKNDTVLIAIENCYLRNYVCKTIPKQEIHVCFVYDFRLEGIISLFNNKGIVSKKAKENDLLLSLKEASSRFDNFILLDTEDQVILDLLTSGMETSKAARKRGVPIKTFYSKKYRMLTNSGIANSSAYALFLLNKIKITSMILNDNNYHFF